MKQMILIALATWPMMIVSPAALAQSDEEKAAMAEEAELSEAEYAKRLKEAEAELAEAAARVAELSMRNLPEIVRIEERKSTMRGKPRLGVTIASDDPMSGPVEGVEIIGVTPGSAAADAGLRSGDVLTAVGSEALSADTQGAANKRLLNIMLAAGEGKKLEIDYLRDGSVGKVTVVPRVVEDMRFVFKTDPDMEFEFHEKIHVAPGAPGAPRAPMVYGFFGSAWGDMELVELNEGLGRYFGTSEGLLVINAPESDAFKLEDGDVIQSIDGRAPKSVNHALRILSSYQPGETLELSIMRDKQSRTLAVEMPDNRRSFVPEVPLSPVPVVAPVAPSAPTPVKAIAKERIVDTRT